MTRPAAIIASAPRRDATPARASARCTRIGSVGSFSVRGARGALAGFGRDGRGVGAGAILKSLQERGLIDVTGRGEGMGRPLLYGTTPLFLEHFALRHLEELPRADELAIALRPTAAEIDLGIPKAQPEP